MDGSCGDEARNGVPHRLVRADRPHADLPPTRVGWEGSILDGERPVAQARHLASRWSQDQWKLAELAESVEIAVGELCANALRHGGGLASLELLLSGPTLYTPPSLRILVADFRPDLPLRTEPADNEELAESGRGLLMVKAMAVGLGWYRVGPDQKQVWCKLAVSVGDLDLSGRS